MDPKLNDTRLLFPSLYMKAKDLQGKEVTLTIRQVVAREALKTERGEEQVMVLYFYETQAKAAKDGLPPAKEKRLVINTSNNQVIGSLYGFNANEWVDKRITLYPGPFKDTGRIMVRPVVPPAAKAEKSEVA